MIRPIALFAALASPAAADPDRVSILAGSRHFGAETNGFNEVNPGLFFTWEQPGPDWTIGAYRNSYGRDSVAVFGSLTLAEGRGWAVEAFAGAALYPEDGRRASVHFGDVVPIGGLSMRAGGVFVQVIPSDGEAVDAIVSFGLTFVLGQ